MSQKFNTAIAAIGIDFGKYLFHVVGHDACDAIMMRQNWLRDQVETRLVNIPPCLIGMKACVGAHHLSRKLKGLGHDARLMPAKYVWPNSKGQKYDFSDTDAVQRTIMKFVANKTADQLDLQALHRMRGAVGQPAHRHHQSDPHFPLERGIAIRQDHASRILRAELPRILAVYSDALSPRMVRGIEDLAGDWRLLDCLDVKQKI